ncbi:MAG: hypothetical protein B7733_06125 [Myxococcales bacterium FL481]|nr:MAG: hypothetical protein B7733_06125 [Myxococcales bacterium FL481]
MTEEYKGSVGAPGEGEQPNPVLPAIAAHMLPTYAYPETIQARWHAYGREKRWIVASADGKRWELAPDFGK